MKNILCEEFAYSVIINRKLAKIMNDIEIGADTSGFSSLWKHWWHADYLKREKLDRKKIYEIKLAGKQTLPRGEKIAAKLKYKTIAC